MGGTESGGVADGTASDAGDATAGSDANDSDSDGSDGGNEQCPEPSPASVVSQVIEPFPAGVELALEDYFATHWLNASPATHLAQQTYVGSCNVDGASPLVYASVSTGDNEDCESEDGLDRYGWGGCGGLLVELAYEEGAGLGATGKVAELGECIELYGVAPSPDCSTVAVLCRRENMATEGAAGEITKNSLLTHGDSDWMTHPLNMTGDGRRMDEIWLYQWPDGDIEGEADKYVVHRAIGTSYGKYSLIRGSDDTYGIGVRSDLFSGDGTMHSADAMLILDAQTFDFTDRGYSWACGVGHTVTNFMAYNPATEKYAMHCMTDWNDDEVPAGDSYIRLEDGDKDNDGDGLNNGYFRHHRWDGSMVGGAIMLQPVSDGGFIGAIVGIPGDTPSHPEPLHEAPVPTSVGVARFQPDGDIIGDIHWLESDEDGLVSHVQLAPLGNDRFLFGWGTMHRFSSYEDDRHMDYKVPHEYHLYEIDDMGSALTDRLDLPSDVGWGEWDEMTPLGDGRTAWIHSTPSTVTIEEGSTSQFDLNRDSLVTHVYTAACP